MDRRLSSLILDFAEGLSIIFCSLHNWYVNVLVLLKRMPAAYILKENIYTHSRQNTAKHTLSNRLFGMNGIPM